MNNSPEPKAVTVQQHQHQGSMGIISVGIHIAINVSTVNSQKAPYTSNFDSSNEDNVRSKGALPGK